MDLNLSEGSSLVLYADDILLYRPVASVADFAGLQSDVDSVHDWTSCNFMTFNEIKCKLMHISRKKSPVLPTTPITLNGTVLETVNTFKYLGLLISSDLSWTPHIQNICSKARKIFGLLYHRYYKYSDQATLLQL